MNLGGTHTIYVNNYANCPWQAIKDLPANYRANPWPHPKRKSREWPLEQLVPFTLLLSLGHGIQSGLVNLASPALLVKQVQRAYSIVTAKAEIPELTGMTGWTPFKAFDSARTATRTT